MNHVRGFAPQLFALAQKYGIAKISVFGSMARGTSTSASDLDLLVEMREGCSLFGIAGFSYEAEKLLGVPVDVIPVSALPAVKDRDFVVNIQRDAIAL